MSNTKFKAYNRSEKNSTTGVNLAQGIGIWDETVAYNMSDYVFWDKSVYQCVSTTSVSISGDLTNNPKDSADWIKVDDYYAGAGNIVGGKMFIPSGLDVNSLTGKYKKELNAVYRTNKFQGDNFNSYTWALWSFYEEGVGQHPLQQFANFAAMDTWCQSNLQNSAGNYTNNTQVVVKFVINRDLTPLYKTYAYNGGLESLKGHGQLKDNKARTGELWNGSVNVANLSRSLLNYFGYAGTGSGAGLVWNTRKGVNMYNMWSVNKTASLEMFTGGPAITARKVYDVTNDKVVLRSAINPADGVNYIEDSVLVNFVGGAYEIIGKHRGSSSTWWYGDGTCRIYKLRITDIGGNDYISFIVKPIGIDKIDFNYISNQVSYKLFAYVYDANVDPYFVDVTGKVAMVNNALQNVSWRCNRDFLVQVMAGNQGYNKHSEDPKHYKNVRFFYADSSGQCCPLTDTEVYRAGRHPGYKSCFFLRQAR